MIQAQGTVINIGGHSIKSPSGELLTEQRIGPSRQQLILTANQTVHQPTHYNAEHGFKVGTL